MLKNEPLVAKIDVDTTETFAERNSIKKGGHRLVPSPRCAARECRRFADLPYRSAKIDLGLRKRSLWVAIKDTIE